MQKTNALKRTFFYLILTLTAFATMFMFTACDFGNNVPDNNKEQTDDSGDTGSTDDNNQTVTHTKAEVKTALENSATTLKNTTDATYVDKDGKTQDATSNLQSLSSEIEFFCKYWNNGELGTVYKLHYDQNHYSNIETDLVLEINNTNNEITLSQGLFGTGRYNGGYVYSLDYDFTTQKLNSVSLEDVFRSGGVGDATIYKAQYNCSTKVYSSTDIEDKTSSEYKQIYNQRAEFASQLEYVSIDLPINTIFNVFSWAHSAIKSALDTESPDENLKKLDSYAIEGFGYNDESIESILDIYYYCLSGLSTIPYTLDEQQQICTSSRDFNLFINKTVSAVKPSGRAIMTDDSITLQVYCKDTVEYFATVQISFDKQKETVTSINYNCATVQTISSDGSRIITPDTITFDPTTGEVNTASVYDDVSASFNAFKAELAKTA